ncbi:hypothetical protein GCM10011309_16120 [Litorimonas cladophorae]|uniref:Uncharacterized protein n=1 Tax=Litorimonas cladophorae TaxID=1220491 RepID=A0A918NH43_9PROT|nr:hypothetical protein GCM10011309_16120 [Litorimonas cladophorae]
MRKRISKKNEVSFIETSDLNTVFSIRKRPDGHFQFYIETLNFEEEEDVLYWSQDTLPRPSLFGSVDDAKAEIYAQFSHLMNPN